jgi:hypothetical protein
VLARDTGATLLIVHVETVPLTTGGGEYIYAIPEPPTVVLLTMVAGTCVKRRRTKVFVSKTNFRVTHTNNRPVLTHDYEAVLISSCILIAR